MINQSNLVTAIYQVLLKQGADYKKYKRVKARLAVEGEEIVSVVQSGPETINYAKCI